MGWTEQQNNAINARNCSVIVSAAAGSGKTAVLTERLSALIADPESGVRADRIIAVTFTNDAASELKKRLNIKLVQLITENPADKHLLKQQTLLQSARISTINAFCFDLLHENITDEGITSGFNVLDENDNELIKSKAMDDLINYYSKNNYDKISYLYDKFCITDIEQLKNVVFTIDRYLSSVAMKKKWIENISHELNKPFEKSLYFESSYTFALKKIKKAFFLAEECCDLINDIFLSESVFQEKSISQSNNDKQRIEAALKMLEAKNIPTENDIMFFTGFEKLVSASKKAEFDASLRETYKTKRKNMITLTKEAISEFVSAEEDYIECRNVYNVLSEFIIKFDDFIWKKKCARNAISFEDGERLVLELLADYDENGRIIPSETAVKISDYFDIIMIDEYQDSNNKQDMIFKLISKNCIINKDGTILHGNNVFLVGDVKQSIYKFRLANPKNFIFTLEHSEKYISEKNNSLNASINLNKNFRSSAGVINYVNYLFEQIMSKECGEINYNDSEKLFFGAEDEYAMLNPNETATQISFITTENSDILNEGDLFTENIEALYTAKKINSMIQEKYPVYLKNGATRPCQPSDFCILVRKNSFIKNYVNELKKKGINAKGEEEKGYLKSREISLLLDLLRVIDNPLLDVPLAAIMLSPMYMFEIEELAYIKTLDKENHIFSILNNIIEGNYKNLNDIFLIERCRDFLESIKKFRLNAVTMTIGELIESIYDTTDFLSVMQLTLDGEKKRANLRALIQYAKNYEENITFESSGGVSGFVRYINCIIENKNDFIQGKISSSSGNYVTVQTIHKSKGLEYPFVFVNETNTEFKYDSSQIMCSDDGRIGFILYNPDLVRRYKTSSYKQIYEENKNDIISEEMRLLYVALTRAKQQIFINMKINKNQIKRVNKLLELYQSNNKSILRTAQNAKCFADWIWLSIFEHKYFYKIIESINTFNEEIEAPCIKKDNSVFDFSISSDFFTEETNTKEIQNESEPDQSIVNNLQDIIDYKYDISMSKLPAKMSVTEITKKFKTENDTFDFKLKRPKFISEDETLTGTERGTAIHTFFQYCNFNNAESDPQTEIKRISKMGYLSTTQAESINIENVSAFFNSELYKRMKKANNIWREKKFMVAISDLNVNSKITELFSKSDGMIKGILDLMFEENKNLVIVDYKTDRGVSEKKMKNRYTIQLKLYKSAIELTTGMKVKECYLYSFELKKSIKLDLE